MQLYSQDAGRFRAAPNQLIRWHQCGIRVRDGLQLYEKQNTRGPREKLSIRQIYVI